MDRPQDIEKALQEIAKAIENNESVQSVSVKINLKRQKPDKAAKEAR